MTQKRVAASIVQLLEQMRENGRSDAEMLAVARANLFACKLNSGYFMADGRPFQSHGVGVASLAEHCGVEVDLVVVALVHNAFGNGDFGDGMGYGAVTDRRLAILRAQIGERPTEMLVRFASARLHRDARLGLDRLDGADTLTRGCLLLEVCDLAERLVDNAVVYVADGAWLLDPIAREGERHAELAERLGQPWLATLIRDGARSVQEAAIAVPESVRRVTGARHMQLIVPNSCRRRADLRLRTWLRATINRVRRRLRTGYRGPSVATAPRPG